MKFFSSIILSALLAYGFGLFTILPWWSFAISSFVIALSIHQTPFKSFLSGFLGVFLLWVILATLIDINNEPPPGCIRWNSIESLQTIVDGVPNA